jgi:hypothetical protein
VSITACQASSVSVDRDSGVVDEHHHRAAEVRLHRVE